MSAKLLELYPVGPGEVQQPETDFFQAYAAAKARTEAFGEKLADFGRRKGVTASVQPGGVKGLERTVEKHRVPLDLLAAKIVVGGLYQMYDVASEVNTIFAVVAYQDRVLQPQKSGYRDLQFIVDVGGHYAELKVMHEFFDQLDEYEHRLYEIRRSLVAKQRDPLTNSQIPLTPLEKLVIDKLNQTSTDLFREAWELVLAREVAPRKGSG